MNEKFAEQLSTPILMIDMLLKSFCLRLSHPSGLGNHVHCTFIHFSDTDLFDP